MAAKKPPRVAFPKKNQKPRPEELAARLPVAAGKRFESVRTVLARQKGVREELFFYGPRSGWAFRYLRGNQSLCTVMIHAGRPLGILWMDTGAASAVDWKALSPVGLKARQLAHGSPSLLWLDVPLEGTGAADFKTLVRAKLRAIPPSAAAVAPQDG
jgi:hypothetical protein